MQPHRNVIPASKSIEEQPYVWEVVGVPSVETRERALGRRKTGKRKNWCFRRRTQNAAEKGKKCKREESEGKRALTRCGPREEKKRKETQLRMQCERNKEVQQNVIARKA